MKIRIILYVGNRESDRFSLLMRLYSLNYNVSVDYDRVEHLPLVLSTDLSISKVAKRKFEDIDNSNNLLCCKVYQTRNRRLKSCIVINSNFVAYVVRPDICPYVILVRSAN